MEKMIEKLSEVLITYGWAGLVTIVLVGVAFALLFKFINKKDKKTVETIDNGFKTMSDMLTAQNTKLINTIIEQNKSTDDRRNESENKMFDLFMKMLSEKNSREEQIHTQKMDHRLNISKDINKKLWTLLNKYNADRIAIAEFHNSKENMNGLSFLWYDIQYEMVADDGVPQRMFARKDVQISTVIPIINDLKESENGLIIYREEDIQQLFNKSSVLYTYLMKELKAKEYIIAGLYNEYNKLIGFMSMEYINNRIHDDLINLTDITAQASSISDLLKYDEK